VIAFAGVFATARCGREQCGLRQIDDMLGVLCAASGPIRLVGTQAGNSNVHGNNFGELETLGRR